MLMPEGPFSIFNLLVLVVGLDHEPKNLENLEAIFFRGIFGRKAMNKNFDIIDK
jgi:hypothetical protein